MLTLENEHLRVDVDVDHGAEITRVGAPGGRNALAIYDWKSPVPAGESTSYGSTQLDWLSRYRGGWQELFPNAGAECEVDGVPVAFHGDASMAPWRVLRSSSQGCELEVAVRLPLILNRRMALAPDAPVLLIEETVTNESDLDVDFLWGHHPVFPSLPGARIDLPQGDARVEADSAGGLGTEPGRWPVLADSVGNAVRLDEITDETAVRVVYVSGIEHGWAALRQPGPQPGVVMAWDVDTFPCIWFWLQNGTPDFPWYGRARMLGLEPHTAAPFDGLAAARERGDAHRIGPRATRTTWLTLALIDQAGTPITGMDRAGRVQFGDAS